MKIKKAAIALLSATVLSVSLSGCSLGLDSLFGVGKNNVFKIEKETCSIETAKVFLVNYQNEYANVYGVDLWKHDFGADNSLENYIKDLTVSQLAEIYTMNLIAKDQDISLTEAQQANVKAASEAYYKSLNEAEIEYTGISEKAMLNLYEHYAIAQKVYQTLTSSVEQEVSDDEARVMKVQQIYTTDKSKIDKVAQELLAGGDFSTLATANNEAEQTNADINRSMFDTATQEVIFALKDNEVSDVISVKDGYYIFKCVKSFDAELTEENKTVVLKKRMEDAVNSTYNTYVSDSKSTLNQKVWSNISIDVNENITTNSFFSTFEEYCGEDYK